MTSKIKFPLIFLSAFLFFFLFWKQALGNNAVIYTVFVLLTGIILKGFDKKKTGFYIISIGTLFSSLYIAYHASTLAIVVWIISLILFQAFLHWNNFRTPIYAFLSAFVDYFSLFNLIKSNSSKKSGFTVKSKSFWKWFKLTIIPAFVFYIFFWIYKWAVPEFDKLSIEFWEKFVGWWNYIFEDISFLALLFFIWGLVTAIWLNFKRDKNIILAKEQKYKNEIVRNKTKDKSLFTHAKNLKPVLKNEFRSGLILIISVNVLLLLVNITDISTIWFGFEYTSDFDLKQFVHEGTYLLILSIMLSMSIMLYFFRQNLNFYKSKKSLQLVSYLWITQNVVLLISVVTRNLYYIQYFGLAYLRIGLFFFLILVVFGLITLWLKIKNNGSMFYLFRVNSWALYIGFILFAGIDWDSVIAKHNLNHSMKNNMETSFLLTLDEKVFPMIDEHKEILKQDEKFNTFKQFDMSYTDVYEQKVNEFVQNYSERSWLAKNHKDNLALEYY
ncbi:MAG: DUF4173 domain-containing protein, partial [Bacteroidales bacterium]|nr:DUF4173 domain-containing protein [Bacteroidales bacterium]